MNRNHIIIIILVVIIAILGALVAMQLNGYTEVDGSTIKDIPSESKVAFTGTFVGSITQLSPSMPTWAVFKVGDEYVFIQGDMYGNEILKNCKEGDTLRLEGEIHETSTQELRAGSFSGQELENLCDKTEPSSYFDMTLGHVEGRFFSLHKAEYV